jgi:oligopeptide transport system substrate-binding protein
VGTFSSNSVEVVSDGTSNAEMIRAFTHLLSSPVPRKVAARDPDAFARKPVCAGPYQLERPFQPGDTEIRVKRFAGYYGKDNTYTAGGAGYADEIVFKVFPDQAAEVAAWQAGQLDIAHVPATELAAVPAQPALAADLVSAPNGSVVYAGTSDGRGQAFANPAFRVALSKAVDRQALNVSISAGGDLPATGFVPPTVGDDQFRANACGANVPARPDVAGARRAYAAGPGQAAPLTFSVNDDFANRKEAEAVSQQWRAALGVNATVVPMQWDEYLATAQGTPGFDGLFLESWRPPYTSIDGYLYQPFDTNGVGQDNWARFTDAGFDEELEHGAREAGGNAPGRYLAYARLEGTLCDRMPMIPLLFRQNHFLVRKARVGSALGTLLERSTGQPMLRELFVRGL